MAKIDEQKLSELRLKYKMLQNQHLRMALLTAKKPINKANSRNLERKR